MRSQPAHFIARSIAGAVFALSVPFLPAPAECSVDLVETEDFSLELGLRLQPRLELERTAGPGGKDWQRDFLIRRSRLKLNGKMKSASYVFEWKIDRTDQIGSTPTASVENAYIQLPLGGGVELRAGLYDLPFSRDRLTSDSKQLAVDRGSVSNVPDALGLADNATGFQLMGKLGGGHIAYAAGAFDNRTIRGDFQDVPMAAGRLDVNFGSTKDVWRDAHFGEETWCSIGLDGNYQGALEDETGVNHGSNSAAGIDGMIDLPTRPGRLFVRGELDAIRTEPPRGGARVETTVWMVGAGFLLWQRFQPIVRFDQIRLDQTAGGGTREVTYVGANLYRRGHDLKIQGDVRLQAGNGDSVDGGRLQAQLDF